MKLLCIGWAALLFIPDPNRAGRPEGLRDVTPATGRWLAQSPPPAQPRGRAKRSPTRTAPAKKAAAPATADAALARAARVEIAALLKAHDRPAALDAYARFAAAAGREDAQLVAPIARDELRALAGEPVAAISAGAREQLARAGDPEARSALARLVQTAGDTPHGRTALLALARLGDEAALAALRTLAATGPAGSRVVAIQVLAEAGYQGLRPLVGALLADRDLTVRAAAADAAAALHATENVPALKKALEEPSSYIRLSAAAALRQLGDPAADDMLHAALTSELPDVRLLAAQAVARGPASAWVAHVQPLLSNPDGLNRLFAAELLARHAPTRGAALDVLRKAAEDSNPVIRGEAVRLLAATAAPPVALLRALLRDTDPTVRLRAAGALVRP